MRRPALNPRRRSWIVLATGFVISSALLAAPLAFSQDGAAGKGNWRAALRVEPDFDRLYHDGKEFLSLPAEKQEAMRQLHASLQKLAPAERDWLHGVLRRYVEWLDRLPETDRRKVLDAPDNQARLQIVKQLRAKEWLARQPLKTRQYLAKVANPKPPAAVVAASTVGVLLATPRGLKPLAGAATVVAESTDVRATTIERLKKAESRRAKDWMIAARHWTDLTDPNRPALPARPADFGPDVETFIKEYLVPVLSPEEKNRLAKNEGKWPQYPLTLVEIADKHPLALPQRSGPIAYKELPERIQKQLAKMAPKKADNSKTWDQYFNNNPKSKQPVEERLAALPGAKPTAAIRFACAVSTFIHSKEKDGKKGEKEGKKGGFGAFKMPHDELWAARSTALSEPMRKFLDKKGPFWTKLKKEEQEELHKAEGLWPEYPLKIQELANRYGYKPPWQTLPEVPAKSDMWEKYRAKPLNRTAAPPPQRGAAVVEAVPFWRRLSEPEVQALPSPADD